jgi:transcriptional regulator
MSGVEPDKWRDGDRYRSIIAGGRPALAWELLRRDRDYYKEFAGKHILQSCVVPAIAECVARWGLYFRM